MPNEVSPEEQRLLEAEQELRDALKKERAGAVGAADEVKAAQQKVRTAFRAYKEARRAATPAGPLSGYEEINDELWLTHRLLKREQSLLETGERQRGLGLKFRDHRNRPRLDVVWPERVLANLPRLRHLTAKLASYLKLQR